MQCSPFCIKIDSAQPCIYILFIFICPTLPIQDWKGIGAYQFYIGFIGKRTMTSQQMATRF